MKQCTHLCRFISKSHKHLLKLKKIEVLNAVINILVPAFISYRVKKNALYI